MLLENNILPESWCWVSLKGLVKNPKGDIVDGPFGSNLKSEDFISSGIPVFKIQNIKANRFVDKNINYIAKEKAQDLARHSFEKNDLILTKLGNPLGLCCKVPEKYDYGIIVADLIRFRPNYDVVTSGYLVYGINSNVVQNQFKLITKGTTRPRVNLTIVRDIQFPLPPLPEQRAIVAKIDELFSELDNGIANLKAAQAKLDIYRQAVLKQAFEGELTREWREKQTDLPSAEVLINFLTNNKKSKKDSTDTILILPEKWIKTELDTICSSISDGDHQAPPKTPNGVPFITISCIKHNIIDFSDTFYVSSDYYSELAIHRKPLKGDVLYTVTGSFGIPVLIDFEKKFCFQRHIGLIRPAKNTNQKWLFWLLQSKLIFKQAQATATGTAQKTVALSSLRSFIIPYCSPEEQNQIVQEIEARLSVCDKLAETIQTSLQQAEALRQSILKKAFEGRLLTETELQTCKAQADWMPAEQLLAQIKSTKAK